MSDVLVGHESGQAPIPEFLDTQGMWTNEQVQALATFSGDPQYLHAYLIKTHAIGDEGSLREGAAYGEVPVLERGDSFGKTLKDEAICLNGLGLSPVDIVEALESQHRFAADVMRKREPKLPTFQWAHGTNPTTPDYVVGYHGWNRPGLGMSLVFGGVPRDLLITKKNVSGQKVYNSHEALMLYKRGLVESRSSVPYTIRADRVCWTMELGNKEQQRAAFANDWAHCHRMLEEDCQNAPYHVRMSESTRTAQPHRRILYVLDSFPADCSDWQTTYDGHTTSLATVVQAELDKYFPDRAQIPAEIAARLEILPWRQKIEQLIKEKKHGALTDCMDEVYQRIKEKEAAWITGIQEGGKTMDAEMFLWWQIIDPVYWDSFKEMLPPDHPIFSEGGFNRMQYDDFQPPIPDLFST